MRSIEELTLYAYGLMEESEAEDVTSHLEACASCLDTIRRLRIERRVFTDAAARGEAPEGAVAPRWEYVKPPRHSLFVASLVAAALIGILVWLLSRPSSGGDGSGPAPAVQNGGDDLDHLVAELKSPSALRREIAELGLKAYGSSAVEKLVQANADASLVDACRGITKEDRATFKKLSQTRITVNMQNTPLLAVVDHLRKISQLNFHIAGLVAADTEIVDFTISNTSLDEALRLLLQPHRNDYRVRNGVVLITTDDEAKRGDLETPTPLSPVRIPVDEETLHRTTAAFSEGSPEERDRATNTLLRLGLAAEPALWRILDSGSPEAQARSAEVLRQLYGAGEVNRPSAMKKKLDELTVDCDFEQTKMSKILNFLGEAAGFLIVISPSIPSEDPTTTYKVRGLAVKNALKLLLSQQNLDFVVVEGVILVVPADGRTFRTPSKPLWTSPEEARRIETMLSGIIHGKAVGDQGPCSREDIPALLLASRALSGPAARRCRGAAALSAEEAQGWLIDQPSGFELQKLSGIQEKILNTDCRPGLDETVDGLLARLGLKHEVKGSGEGPIRAYGTTVKVGSLLKVLTRPSGRDFYMDGESIVVDTARKVRAAVDR